MADIIRSVPPANHQGGDLRHFVWRVLIVIGALALTVLIWQAAKALLLVFAGVLFAILMLRLTGVLHARTGLPHRWSLGIVLMGLMALIAVGGWLLGSTVAAQFDEFSDQIGRAFDRLPQDVRDRILLSGEGMEWMGRLRTAASGILYFLGDIVIVVFVGAYMAVSPGVYRDGLILLVPPAGHARAREVLDTTGDALWKWLMGQLLSMLAVGAVTTAVLLMLGIPAAMALGIVAAVLEFIPFIGPIIAAVPAVLIGFAQGPETALWVAAAYLGIQQIESNLILPLVQKRMVDLPPVITIAAVTVGGLLFGLLGMFLATPLAVATLVLVNLLYLEDRLGERRHFPS